MIPRLKPALGLKEIVAACRRPQKDDIERFEKDFASLMGQKYALAFPYGRTGIIFLLEALGLKNREIICPAYTCVVVPHAITFSKNKPILIDCADGGFNMDLDKAEAAINENTGAIIATSIFGYPVDLDRLDIIREKYPHVQIVQDCAHSFAAEWKGRPVQKEGVAAVFGMNISKLLTSVFGGMITTDDDEIYRKLKTIRDQRVSKPDWKKSLFRLLYLLSVYPTFSGPVYGFINKLERSGLLDRFVKYYDESIIDMPDDYLIGMTNLEARVGRANITRYRKIIRDRRNAAKTYFRELQPKKRSDLNLNLPPEIDGATYSHFVVPVDDRDHWFDWGIRNDVQIGWLIEYTIPELEAYHMADDEGYPVSSKYAKSLINLPVWGGKKIAKVITEKI